MVMGQLEKKLSKRERRELRKKTGFCASTGKNTNILGVNTKNYAEKCGWCDDNAEGIKIEIPIEIYSVWLTLMLQMENKEWGGVYNVKDGKISDFRIPRQEVAGASCEFLEELGGNGIIHSHHNMGSFHSGQDDIACRNNYYCSIVISNSGMLCTCKVNLPCTGFGYKKAELVITGCPVVDLSKFEEKKTVTYDYRQQDWGYNNGGHYENGIWVYDKTIEHKTDLIGINDTPNEEEPMFRSFFGPHICDYCTKEGKGEYWVLENEEGVIMCSECMKEEEKNENGFRFIKSGG